MKKSYTVQEILDEQLQDPEFRAEWERTRLGREVSIWLLQYRTRHNLTQTQLARILGWKQPQVARLESGEHEPSIATLHHIARTLGARAQLDITPDSVGVRFTGGRGRAPQPA